MASSSNDLTVKLWDLEDGKAKLTLKHNDIVQSLSWNAEGSMLVTTSRDKRIRFWDVRQEKPAHEVAGHAGAKSSRCVWMGDLDRVATTGFSKMSERQLGLWDIRSPEKPVGGDFMFLDSSSGVGMPFWDDGSHILYIAGKGDGNIRYYEYENDKFEYLSEHKSPEPQRGLAFIPKRGVNTHENEVMRAFKTVNDAWIEPISFIVPRKAESFQEDIYPPAVGTTAGVSSSEWLSGKTSLPPKVSMEDIYDGNTPTEIPASEVPKPTATRSAPAPEPAPAPVAVKAPEPKVEPPEPTPTVVQAPASIADTKQSVSAMASRVAEKEGPEEDDDDSSSFEEIEDPVRRMGSVRANGTSHMSSAPEPKTLMRDMSSSGPTIRSDEAPRGASTATSSTPISTPSDSQKEEPIAATSSSGVSSAAGGLRDVLQEIRGLLLSQGKQIEQLTSEVAQLKAKVG